MATVACPTVPHAETLGDMTDKVSAREMRERIFADVSTWNVRRAVSEIHYMGKGVNELRE